MGGVGRPGHGVAGEGPLRLVNRCQSGAKPGSGRVSMYLVAPGRRVAVAMAAIVAGHGHVEGRRARGTLRRGLRHFGSSCVVEWLGGSGVETGCQEPCKSGEAGGATGAVCDRYRYGSVLSKRMPSGVAMRTPGAGDLGVCERVW